MDKRTATSREKKKLKDRLQLLNDGRRHYLEFLRNLTPQIVLLTMLIYISTRLIDGDVKEAWEGYFIAATLLAAYLLSLYANTTVFYGNCFPHLKAWMEKEQRSAGLAGITGFGTLWKISRRIWEVNLVEALEAFLALVLIQVVISVTFAISAVSAVNMLQDKHDREQSRPAPTAQQFPAVKKEDAYVG